MLRKSLIGKVLLQVLGVGAYFGLVVILYWQRLGDVGAVAIVLGMLFFFKSVIASGAISIAHLIPSDPKSNIRSLWVELVKAVSFFAVGMGLVVDLGEAVRARVVPETLATATILLTLGFVCAAFVACCLARLTVAFIYGSRR